MTEFYSFTDFAARLREFISQPVSDERDFDSLALALFRLQFQHNTAYRDLCAARGVDADQVRHWTEIPTAPTSAFKEMEMTSLPAGERSTVFHSSGTTEQRPSRHFHNAESLELYEASLLPWFRAHLLADCERLVLLALTPPPAQAPHSSLAHMFDTVRRALGADDSAFLGNVDASGAWVLDCEATASALHEAVAAKRPLLLLGTAFSFVHLLDHFAERELNFTLPAGSRALETGGYKGRARALPKAELHALISRRLGIPASHLVSEYGMSELCSQAYDRVAGGMSQLSTLNSQPSFHFPPWARARVVSPETGREVAEGETGLLQVFDLANLRSVPAIQTEDLAVRRGAGFELIGRAAQAESRGCSLMSV